MGRNHVGWVMRSVFQNDTGPLFGPRLVVRSENSMVATRPLQQAPNLGPLTAVCSNIIMCNVRL